MNNTGTRNEIQRLLRNGGWLVALLVTLSVVASRQRGPELVEYTSPPLSAFGNRLHIMIPDGWTARFHSHLPLYEDQLCLIRFAPQSPFAGWPAWISSLLPKPGSEDKVDVLAYAGENHIMAEAESEVPYQLDGPDGPWITARAVSLHHVPLTVAIGYTRSDQAAFARTHSRIWKSVALR